MDDSSTMLKPSSCINRLTMESKATGLLKKEKSSYIFFATEVSAKIGNHW